MRLTREPIPSTFNGKPAEYPVFAGFRNLGAVGKTVYVVAALATNGTAAFVVEGLAIYNARRTARQSLNYKHELEQSAPNGQLPQNGLIAEYAGYAQQIAQTAGQLRMTANASPAPSYMGVARTSDITPSAEMPGQFEQRVREQSPAQTGVRNF